MSKDFYHILGVEKNATGAEIKKAYRNLAKDLHPDVNPSTQAAAAFRSLNDAYVVLVDKEKRAAYDAYQRQLEVALSHDKLREILRKRQASATRDFRFQPRKPQYPPTNYKATEKTATILNILMMCFALTLILDFFINRPIGTYAVNSIKQKMMITGDLYDVDKYLLSTEKGVLEISSSELRQLDRPPQFAELRESLIYGNLSFRLSDQTNYIRNQGFVLATYLFVIVTFLAASTGLFPSLSAERKFNAAIISTFFSLAIVALLLIG